MAALAACGTAVPGAAGAAGTVAPPAAQRLLGAAVAYDPGSGSVIAFGGQDRTGRQIGPSSLTWRWTGERWQPVATPGPPARSSALMAADASGRGLLMFGGRTETFTLPSCPAPSAPGQPCTGSVSPSRLLSDTWTFTAGRWKRLPAGPRQPGQGELLADDPAIGAVVLVGQSLAYTPASLPGTWKWTGRTWSLLSPTIPDQADSMGYDPVSHRLLAYGGMQPSFPKGDMGAPATVGYTQTWALTGAGWVELHPPNTPRGRPDLDSVRRHVDTPARNAVTRLALARPAITQRRRTGNRPRWRSPGCQPGGGSVVRASRTGCEHPYNPRPAPRLPGRCQLASRAPRRCAGAGTRW
jgi:hypothetical protein